MILFEIAFGREAKPPNGAVVFLRFVRDEGHLSKFNKSQLYLKKRVACKETLAVMCLGQSNTARGFLTI